MFGFCIIRLCRSHIVKALPFIDLISSIIIWVKLYGKLDDAVVSHPAAVRISPSGLTDAIAELQESSNRSVSQ